MRAIVTGGAGLIGTGICADLAAAGWEVASFDLEDGPGGIRHIPCDVAQEEAVAAAFAALGWDALDLLVNNAGIAGAHGGPLAELSLADWRRVTDSHLTGTFLMSRAALPLLRRAGAESGAEGGASIVNIASTRAFMSEPHSEAYAAAKGGIVALTHALAVSLGPAVRANAIAPGWISGDAGLSTADHAQHPAGRVGRPADVAAAVLYLAGAGFVTGQVLTVDGGMTRRMIYAE